MKRHLVAFAVLFLTVLTFSACNNSSNNNTSTGRFVDGPVEGLRYSTATGSGYTNAGGEFTYQRDEAVSFYVGDILLGTATGADTITPFDLAGIAPPRTAAEIHSAVNLYAIHATASPFEIASNIAIFLQTLDQDGDSSNGIQIPARLHELAANMQFDFKQTASTFETSFNSSALLAKARAANVWSDTRSVVKRSTALTALYSALSVVPEIYAMTEFENDKNADGIVDSRTSFVIDALGRVVQENIDSNADGVVDSRTTYVRDVMGQTIQRNEDSNADGTVDQRTVYTYETQGGRIAEITVDSNVDGNVDARTIWNYDPNNLYTLVQYDTDGDGIINSTALFSRSSDGRVETDEYDDNADLKIDRRTISTFENGQLITRVEDFNGDGVPDSRTTNHYDAAGNLVSAETDSNVDGVIDVRQVNTWDVSGYLSVIEEDRNADGQIDYRIVYRYDTSRNLVTLEVDTNGDNSVDLRSQWTHVAVNNWELVLAPVPPPAPISPIGGGMGGGGHGSGM